MQQAKHKIVVDTNREWSEKKRTDSDNKGRQNKRVNEFCS